MTRHSPTCADSMPAGRDLKSPNFLYIHNAESGTYSTLLADFGEVTSVEYLEGGGDSQEGLIGTPNWAAPEILSYPRTYSQSSDVFALALVVFECLAGETLGGEFLKRHSLDGQYFDFSQFTMKGGRPSLEELEAAHGAVVCRALAKAWAQDAASRGTAAELAEGLEGGEMVVMDSEVAVVEHNPVAEAPAVHPVLRPTIQKICRDDKGTLFRLTDFSESLEDQERAEQAERAKRERGAVLTGTGEQRVLFA